MEVLTQQPVSFAVVSVQSSLQKEKERCAHRDLRDESCWYQVDSIAVSLSFAENRD